VAVKLERIRYEHLSADWPVLGRSLTVGDPVKELGLGSDVVFLKFREIVFVVLLEAGVEFRHPKFPL
jgi:hypothetical protein